MGAFLAGMPLVFPGLLKIHNPSKQYLLNPDCKVLPGIAGFL